jgi:ATP-binding cassette subfamily F protein uup
VRALEAMRRERAARREAGGTVRMAASDAASSGRKVIEATNASVALGGRTLVRDFSTVVMRGDRIGVIGPNGSGKTTLLKQLLGQLAPDSGTVKLGTGLQVAYFDQQRAQLREDLSASDNVADGAEFIELEGARKHVLGYLQDFLFSPAQARAPITALSGGERNRLLLARLFARPFNLLVMDEPTNDLDIETLELLEELLAAFNGTLLLVSHDREFIDNVVTSTLVLEGDGQVGEYVGGYTDWLRQRTPAAAARAATRTALQPQAEAAPSSPASPATKRKVSYKDARELADLPQRIETLEARLAALSARMHEPSFYQAGGDAIVAANTELAALQADLDRAYERWQALL